LTLKNIGKCTYCGATVAEQKYVEKINDWHQVFSVSQILLGPIVSAVVLVVLVFILHVENRLNGGPGLGYLQPILRS
jgi:uncharacterized membrane protein